MEQPIRPNLQYAVFCSEFVESQGQASILGILDAVDVRGTLPRGQTVPRKVFPLKLALGINAPEGYHTAKLEISRPTGGISTTIDLESFELYPEESVHRCIANLEMEVEEDGTYTFTVYLDNAPIGWAVLPISFVIEFID